MKNMKRILIVLSCVIGLLPVSAMGAKLALPKTTGAGLVTSDYGTDFDAVLASVKGNFSKKETSLRQLKRDLLHVHNKWLLSIQDHEGAYTDMPHLVTVMHDKMDAFVESMARHCPSSKHRGLLVDFSQHASQALSRVAHNFASVAVEPQKGALEKQSTECAAWEKQLVAKAKRGASKAKGTGHAGEKPGDAKAAPAATSAPAPKADTKAEVPAAPLDAVAVAKQARDHMASELAQPLHTLTQKDFTRAELAAAYKAVERGLVAKFTDPKTYGVAKELTIDGIASSWDPVFAAFDATEVVKKARENKDLAQALTTERIDFTQFVTCVTECLPSPTAGDYTERVVHLLQDTSDRDLEEQLRTTRVSLVWYPGEHGPRLRAAVLKNLFDVLMVVAEASAQPVLNAQYKAALARLGVEEYQAPVEGPGVGHYASYLIGKHWAWGRSKAPKPTAQAAVGTGGAAEKPVADTDEALMAALVQGDEAAMTKMAGLVKPTPVVASATVKA
jgi:hypothetical protein